MAETKIEWTATVRPDGTTVPGYTFNPWRGCTKVSDGCRSCYADTMSKRNPGTLGVWGPNGTRVVAAESYWRLPEKWNREAAAARERRRVFCASLADVFEGPETMPKEAWPKVSEARSRLMNQLIPSTPNLDYLLLTKRPQHMTDWKNGFIPRCWADQWPANVWAGVSIENQQAADERIPHLLRVPAAVRFLSMEPLLGPVNLDQWLHPCCERGDREGESPCPICIDHGRKYEPSGLGWIIAGGESGNDARPMQIEWVRSILQQCRSAGVPCFIKQLGDDPRERNPSAWPVEPPTGRWPNDPGRKPLKLIGDGFGNHLVRGLRSKGGDWNDWPADLRVREIPR